MPESPEVEQSENLEHGARLTDVVLPEELRNPEVDSSRRLNYALQQAALQQAHTVAIDQIALVVSGKENDYAFTCQWPKAWVFDRSQGFKAQELLGIGGDGLEINAEVVLTALREYATSHPGELVPLPWQLEAMSKAGSIESSSYVFTSIPDVDQTDPVRSPIDFYASGDDEDPLVVAHAMATDLGL